ncbi:MAG: XrtA/PEP-CTERM system histidine kinase PrsK [Nitrospiria bacterium]
MDLVSLNTLPSLIGSLFSFGFALFVGLKSLRRPANLGFAIAMLGLGLQETRALLPGSGSDPNQILFLAKFTIFGSILMGGGWLLFSMTFARPNDGELIKRKTGFMALYGLLLIFLFVPVFEKPALLGPSSHTLPVSKIGFVFFIGYLFALVFILMNLEQTFRDSSGITRYQIKYMILGAGTILALEVYRTGQTLLFSVFTLDALPFYSVALIISYFLILFAVVRHRLLNVDIFVSRYMVYKSVTLLAVGAYLGIVGLMIIGVQRFGNETYVRLIPIVVFAALLGMVILLLSEGLRWKMQTFINVNFYRNKHDYRNKWQEFTHAVGSKLVLPELLPSLSKWLGETIGTDHCAIWLLDTDRSRYYLASRRGFSSAPATWSDQSTLIHTIKMGGTPFELTHSNMLYEEIEQEASSFFEANPITAWVPLYSSEKMIGVLALGRKIIDEHYDYHDLELLMTIADQAAGQIDRVRLIEELAVVRELKAIHTLSSFFLHDLKNYTSTLSLLSQNVEKHGSNPEFQKDAFETIRGTVDKMNQLIKHITVVAKGLMLARSEVDLNHLVDSTLARLDGALGLKGRICSIFGELPKLSGDPEQLANVLRNLIINACNASDEEGAVTIETRAKNDHVYFSVSDEGCGMTEEFIATKLFKPLRTSREAGWGIGLFQCQQVVKAHGGKIHVESQEGVGSTFTVELPVGGEQ